MSSIGIRGYKVRKINSTRVEISIEVLSKRVEKGGKNSEIHKPPAGITRKGTPVVRWASP